MFTLKIRDLVSGFLGPRGAEGDLNFWIKFWIKFDFTGIL